MRQLPHIHVLRVFANSPVFHSPSLISDGNVCVPAPVQLQINRAAAGKAVILKSFVRNIRLVLKMAAALAMKMNHFQAVELRLSSAIALIFADRRFSAKAFYRSALIAFYHQEAFVLLRLRLLFLHLFGLHISE